MFAYNKKGAVKRQRAEPAAASFDRNLLSAREAGGRATQKAWKKKRHASKLLRPPHSSVCKTFDNRKKKRRALT